MKIRHSKITASVDTGMSYWYLFKHGLGPGTMPKGVNVLKVIDDGWKDYVLLDKMLTTEELNEYEIKEATPPDDLLAENGYSSLEETYQDVTSSADTAVEAADNMNIFRFYDWYNTLPLKQRHEVDDWCDEWGYPLYDDCSAEDLSTIHDHFESEFSQRNESNFHVAAFGNDYDELQTSFDFDNPKAAITKWVELQKAWPLNVMITGFQKAEEQLREYVAAHPDWYRALSEKHHCPYDPEYIIAECEKPVRPRTGQYANIYPDQCHPFGLG